MPWNKKSDKGKNNADSSQDEPFEEEIDIQEAAAGFTLNGGNSDDFNYFEEADKNPEDSGDPLDIPTAPDDIVPEDTTRNSFRKTYHERQSEQEEYDTARQLRQSVLLTIGAFKSACRTGQILRGKIAVTEVDEKDAYWVIYEGPVTVRIPFMQAYPSPPENLRFVTDSSVIETRQRMLSRNIGVEIDYVAQRLTGNDEEGYFVTGSRIIAIARTRRRYFREDSPVKTNVGDVVRGTIMAVNPHAVRVYVRGYEVTIKSRDLSHRFIDDARSFYKPGDIVRVKVMSLENEETGAFELNVSMKEIEKESFPALYHRIKPGTETMATIISVRMISRDRLRITMFSDTLGLPLFADLSQLHYRDHLLSGGKATVRLYGTVNPSTGFARCEIRAFLQTNMS